VYIYALATYYPVNPVESLFVHRKGLKMITQT